MRIIFESHATTTDNEAELSSGWNDVDLSEFGHQNVQDLRERYRNDPPEIVFCSDLMRSYKTGALAFEGTGVRLVVDKRLRECDYGDLTQASKAKVDALKAKHISVPFPGGESYEQALIRLESFLHDLRAYSAELVMIIGHRATQYGLEAILKKRPLEEVVTEPWKWQPGWMYTLEN